MKCNVHLLGIFFIASFALCFIVYLLGALQTLLRASNRNYCLKIEKYFLLAFSNVQFPPLIYTCLILAKFSCGPLSGRASIRAVTISNLWNQRISLSSPEAALTYTNGMDWPLYD